MKMFLVVYAEASDETITKAFKNAGYKSYTKMHGATGEGEESEPKLDTHFWPGRNNTLMLAVPDEDVLNLLDLVRKLKVEQPRAGLRAFTFPWKSASSDDRPKEYEQTKRYFPASEREEDDTASAFQRKRHTPPGKKGK